MFQSLAIGCAAAVLVSHVAAGTALAQIRTALVASGLTQPVAFVQAPSDPTVQVIVQQDGRVRVLKDGVLQAADYLDLRAVVRNAGEQGLLGLAFAPDYATSGRVFVDFVNLAGDTVIARFRRSAADPLRADPASRFDFRWPDGRRVIPQPFANHNGGNLAFGPDGYLYVGLGDGGSGNDPMHLAQNPQSLLGKMLRLDVSVQDAHPDGYDVPASNPFVGQPGVLGEIWSFGLRNPWRWSFDDPALGGTGALLIGDVGQNAFEEVNVEPAGRGGRNYGWRNREGAHPNVATLPPFSQPLEDPILEYGRDVGQSITGGVVNRGRLLGASAVGRYFFGDFIASRVWSFSFAIDVATGDATASDLVEHTGDLGPAASNPASFGVDAAGELYVVNYGGTVYRLFSDTPVPDPPPAPEPGPGRRRPPGAPVVGIAVPRAVSTNRPPDIRIRTTPAGADAVTRGTVSVTRAGGWWGEMELVLGDLSRDGFVDVAWRVTTGGTVRVWIWFAR